MKSNVTLLNRKSIFKYFIYAVISLFVTVNAFATPPGNKSKNGSSPRQIKAQPEDYILAEDLTLSTGEVMLAGTEWYRVPDIDRLRQELSDGAYAGDTQWGESVVFGFDIMSKTYTTIGEARTDGLPAVAIGQTMNCSSCHAQGGTVPYAWPFFRTISYFGLRENGDAGSLWSNLGYLRDARSRARDCGRHCGGVVNLVEESVEMDGLVDWMIAIRDGIYSNEGLLIPEFKDTDVNKIPGARIPLFANVLDMQADPFVGATIYKKSCRGCHGADGEGKWSNKNGFGGHPPLAGNAAFTEAGGPLMVPVGAAFIYRQMPLSKPGTLTEQEALDVMAHIATLPRGTRWWQDNYFEHLPCRRPAFLPIHVGAVPAGYPFTAEQTQFGPWREIGEWLASDTCRDLNPVGIPVLGEDFDSMWPNWSN